MNIFDKVRELGLATDQYVVIAGGVLVALGLLDWDDDIDLAVTPEVFERFRRAGWRESERHGKLLLKRDVYDVGVGFDPWNLQDLQQDAIWIDGIPFMHPQKVLDWKKRTGREKDAQHIALLEAYVAAQSTGSSGKRYTQI